MTLLRLGPFVWLFRPDVSRLDAFRALLSDSTPHVTTKDT
jgi:hypothetical protein